MYRKRGFFFTILLLGCACLSLQAVSTGYSIESLESDITISADGVYGIAETVDMRFQTPLHGFYRTLPVMYRFQDPGKTDIRVHVMDIRVSESFSTYTEGDYLVIKVGNADRTVTGDRRYHLSYTYDIGADRNVGYDEFYMNIVGEDWEVPIGSYVFTIRFPKPIANQAITFTRGVWGTTTALGVEASLSEDGTVLSGRVSNLLPGEAVTVSVLMDEGYYAARTDWQGIVSHFNFWISLAAVGLAVFFWFRHGRDHELIIVPQFYPPKGMTPVDMGYLIDGTLDPRDVTSMIFYWADKGCLTIVEDNKKFSFIKGHDPVDPSPHEKQLFNAFFKSGKNGAVSTSDLEGKFFVEYQKLGGTISRYYSGARSLTDAKARNMAALSALLVLVPAIGFSLAITMNYPGALTLVIIVASLVVAALLGVIGYFMMRTWHLRKSAGKIGWGLLFALVALVSCPILGIFTLFADVEVMFGLTEAAKAMAAIAPLAFFAVIIRKRSEYGRKQLELILGFRDFIDKVEIEKLQRMIDEDPQYYYHTLSYAIVMGLEKKWAKKFASITLEPPAWYRGGYDVWNIMFLSSMLNRCNSSLITSAVSVPKTSPGGHFGGSSFGGGGFSGGGFGGGGGGAW
jgi:uncharacterized membrane protein YgcG